MISVALAEKRVYCWKSAKCDVVPRTASTNDVLANLTWIPGNTR